jgi:hypothetical protein
MDWKNTVKDILQAYSGKSGGTVTAAEDPHQDFKQVAQAAPPDVLASGISQAFRSDRTPPFPEMLANLFSQSDSNQRAGVLNQLLSSVGPETLTAIPGLSGLSSILRGGSVSPEQASQISPDQVQQMASQAERQNPSIVDHVSNFYAQHPEVMKAVGGLALTIALQHMMRRR